MLSTTSRPGTGLLVAALLLSACGGTNSGTPDAKSLSSTPGSHSSGSSGPPTYTVGGTVNGLSTSGLVLQNNGGDNLTLNTSGRFAFATSLLTGQPYSVTIAAQPTSQLCAVTVGAVGTIGSANVTSVQVDCRATPMFNIAEYPLPGVTSGLARVNGSLWAFSSIGSSTGGTWTNSLNQIATDGSVLSVPVQGVLATSAAPLAGSVADPTGIYLWFPVASTATGGGTSTNITSFSEIQLTDTANSTAGTVLTPLANQSGWLNLLMSDPQGNLWIASAPGSSHPSTVSLVAPTGVVVASTTYPDNIVRMAVGQDGRAWFSSQSASGVSPDAIGAITVKTTQNDDGTTSTALGITTYPLPFHSYDGTPQLSQPVGIALGPDGNMWFVETSQPTLRIGTITPTGEITEYPVTGASGYVLGPDIAPGPDGNLWFSVWPNEVGYITPAGQTTISTLPTPDAWPTNMTSGPDGRMWFIEPANMATSGKVGAISLQ